MSDTHYCVTCGRKLKPGAKFCTICGTRQNKPSYAQRNSNYNRTPSRTDSQNSSQSTSESAFRKTMRNATEIKIVNKIPEVEKSSNRGFTLTTLTALEVEIDDLNKEISTKEKQVLSLEVIDKIINQSQDSIKTINESLSNYPETQVFLKKSSWLELKENKIKYNVTTTFLELDYLLFLLSSMILTNNITSWRDFYASEQNQVSSLTSTKSKLKQQQEALENSHKQTLKGLTNYNQYSKVLTNLSHLEAKSIEEEDNLFFLDEIRKAIESMLDALNNIKMDIDYNVSSLFAYNKIIPSFENVTFRSFINKCATIQSYSLFLKYYSFQIKIKERISFYNNWGIMLLESVLKDFFYHDSFTNAVSLVENLQSLTKDLKEQVSRISNGIKTAHRSTKNGLSVSKDILLKMRQEFLMRGKLRTSYSVNQSLPELEKQTLLFDYGLSLGSKSEFLTNLDNNTFSFHKTSLQDVIEKNSSEVAEQRDTDAKFEELKSQDLSTSVFKISMPKLPKLTSMQSSFFESDENNEIKSELRRINYMFKKTSFDSEFRAESTFHTGSIKFIEFEFPQESATLRIEGQLNLNIGKEIHFVLNQKAQREDYSWEYPYAGIQIEEASDEIIKRLLRERRIAEKFKAIPGKGVSIVYNDSIKLILENKKEVIQPAIEFLKETSFILNLSFRY